MSGLGPSITTGAAAAAPGGWAAHVGASTAPSASAASSASPPPNTAESLSAVGLTLVETHDRARGCGSGRPRSDCGPKRSAFSGRSAILQERRDVDLVVADL